MHSADRTPRTQLPPRAVPEVLHRWETVTEDRRQKTERMRVPGGWLYAHSFVCTPEGDTGCSVAFVPAP